MSASDNIEEFKELGGLRKNFDADCWEFEELVQSNTTQSTTNDESQTSAIPPPPPTESPAHEHPDDAHDSPKKKKHRKKKRNGKKHSDSDTAHHVRWGQVKEYCFERDFGYDAIPTNGKFPLGLGDMVEEHIYTIDEVWAKQQMKDYLASLDHTKPPQDDEVMTTVITTNSKKKKGSKSQNSTSNNTNNNSKSSTQRKDSFDLSNNTEDNQSKQSTSTNTLSSMSLQTDSDDKEDLGACALKESERIKLLKNRIKPKANGNKLTIPQNENLENMATVDIDELNKEIQEIQDSRDFVGCACRPMKLDKLNVAKLKAELISRIPQLSSPLTAKEIEKMKKAELIHYMRDALRECVLCIDNNCECVQQNISCSANACDCGTRTASDGGEHCVNPFGKYAFDLEGVRIYREKMLSLLNQTSEQAKVLQEQQIQQMIKV